MLRTKMTKGGKVVIPAAYRKQLHIKNGDEIIFELQEHKVVMTSLQAVLQQSRQLIQKYVNQPQPSSVEMDTDIDININKENVASTNLQENPHD